MSSLSFTDLRQMIEVFLREWAVSTITDEPLIPVGTGAAVTKWTSRWDNWLLASDADGVAPLILKDNSAFASTDFSVSGHGDGVRGEITLTHGVDVDSIILATYRRKMFPDSFWQSIIRTSIMETNMRLLTNIPPVSDLSLDLEGDPWPIVVKLAGKSALINLQVMMAGLGKSTIESVSMDLSRAHSMIHEVIDDLEQDIDRDVVAWRWGKSPMGRAVVIPVRGPGPWGAWMAGRLF